MGKPYSKELSVLNATQRWAAEADISSLRDFVNNCKTHPLIAVGVGGSFTAATFAARLHESQAGFAIAKTTLDFTSSVQDLRKANIIIFTGRGKNRDVLSAFDFAVASEAQSVAVVCASRKSVIANRASIFSKVTIFDFELPSGGDGFLATNTLLATTILLARAYGYEDFSGNKSSDKDLSSVFTAFAAQKKDTLIALYSGWSTAAAVDLESKCSESALSNVLLCDYRNFAHGRHQWLAKRANSSALIALVTPAEEIIAYKTLRLVPSDVPVLILRTASYSNPRGAIDLLIDVFHLTGALGKAQQIDPGRPGVPRFGSRIYNLNAQIKSAILEPTAENVQTIAIRRKYSISPIHKSWDSSYQIFLEKLESTTFSGVVFDFDGTLCGSKDRLLGVSGKLRRILVNVAKCGILIGIATGRGKSAKVALRDIIPRDFWGNVLLGYYNGAEIASLAEDTCPQCDLKPAPVLVDVEKHLKSLGIAAICKIEVRGSQLTLQPNVSFNTEIISNIVQEFLAKSKQQLRLVYSSHSLDVLAPNASKLHVVDACRSLLGNNSNILCIGDRGAWPGNDFEILSTPYSLSVDTVSASPETCWNLAPAGISCVEATNFYMAGFKRKGKTFTFSLQRSITWFQKARL